MKAESGKYCAVSHVPACDFCQDGTPGPYDFATTLGPWAHGCEAHWKTYRVSPSLGVGVAQFWFVEEEVA